LKRILGLDVGNRRTNFHFGGLVQMEDRKVSVCEGDHWGPFTGMAHIPIRDPLALSLSWQSRYGEDETWELDALDELIEFASTYPRRKLYRMEDYSVRLNQGPGIEGVDFPRVQRLARWLQNGRLDFFLRFYGEETFGWL
jgi:hypothetical protein